MMNKTLKFLMFADIFYFTGFGLVAPIIAIFIKEDLVGGTIVAAGVATTVFIIVKSVVQLPFSRFIDRQKNNIKLRWLRVGYALIVFNPFIYILAQHVGWIYFAEALHGFGSGLAFPAWLGMWSLHLDKGHESFEWSLYSTVVGVGAAITAAVGAAIAEFIGFDWTFFFVGIMAFLGFITLFFLKEKDERYCKASTKQYHIKRKVKNHHKHF